MKYIPSEEAEEINSKTEKNPWLNIFVLVTSSIVIYIVFLFTLGLIGETLAVKVSPQFEAKIFSSMDFKFKSSPWPMGNDLANDIFKNNPIDNNLKPEIFYSCEPTVNAIALPGKKIIIFKGLVEKLTSLNSLYFIIGHEIGHIIHRDHLKSLGRALAISVGLFFINVGGESNSFFSLNNAILDRRFSQKQEEASDELAIDYTIKRFKGLNHSHEFFDSILKEEPSSSKLINFMSTHPMTQERIQKMRMNPNYNSKSTILEKFNTKDLICI